MAKRYERQIIMKEIGEEGQEKLKKAVVAVVGCGGLGAPALTYLAGAGIGTLKLIDCGDVSESNLNRQFLHGYKDIGRKKVESAKEKLCYFNPDTRIYTTDVRAGEGNGADMLKGADVVVDCVDNITTRLAVNRLCLSLGIPLVEGGISGFYGFVMSVSRDTACLECLGWEGAVSKKAKKEIPVLGTTAGVVGSIQANEAIKIILNLDGILYGRMLSYDGLNYYCDVQDVKKLITCKAHNNVSSLSGVWHQ